MATQLEDQVTEEKVRENRLRRMAERRGLLLTKSRRRDPGAVDYGRYWVIDPGHPDGGNNITPDGLHDLDEVEYFLNRGRFESR